MSVERDPGWPRLRRALAAGGCVLCRAAAEASDRSVRSLLREHVNDVDTRAALDAALGFCPRHWDAVTARGDALANAILLRSVLAEAERRLGGRRRTRRTRLVPGDPCSVCAAEQQAEQDAAALLCAAVEQLPDANTLQANADPLCLRHLDTVAETRTSALGRARILANARERLRTLDAELAAIVEAHDHRHVHRLDAATVAAWPQALAVARGGTTRASPSLPPRLARALAALAGRLAEHQVPYLLGGSALLCALGLVREVRDLDLMLPADALPALRRAVPEWMSDVTTDGSELWASSWKATLDVDGVAADAVGGVALRRDGEVVRIPFRQRGTWRVLGVDVPLAAPELWWAIYTAYRPERARLLERVVPAEERERTLAALGLDHG